jgi:hypothetical protein
MVAQVVDHLVPNQATDVFEFQGERERGSFLFSKACRTFIGADSRNLKMRRLPPTSLPTQMKKTRIFSEFVLLSFSPAGYPFWAIGALLDAAYATATNCETAHR